MRVALCIGHSRAGDLGAVAADGFTHEWTFWRFIAQRAKLDFPDNEHDIRIYDAYKGRSYTEAMTDIACRLRRDRVDLAIELHFNAYNGKASGREAFYWHSSADGQRFAETLLDIQGDLVGQDWGDSVMRGAKPANQGTRGAQFLRKTHCPAVIWEGFFGDNDQEWGWYSPREGLLALALSEAILAWEPYMLG